MKLAFAASLLPLVAVSKRNDALPGIAQRNAAAAAAGWIGSEDRLLSRNRNQHGMRRSSFSSRQRRLHHQNGLTLGNHLSHLMPLENEGQPCDPSSVEPDIGILSCGIGNVCRSDANSFLGGTCTPVHDSDHGKALKNKNIMATKVECDPSETSDPDVGLLAACPAPNERCVPDGASSLGGFCMSTFQENGFSNDDHQDGRRQLGWYVLDGGICDPFHPTDEYSCDCSGFDYETGTGTVSCKRRDVCLGIRFPGCNDLCLGRDTVYTWDNSAITDFNFCWTTKSASSGTAEDSAQKFCLYEDFEERSCEIKFNDQICYSCDVAAPTESDPDNRYYNYIYFDCTNIEGGPNGTDLYIEMFPLIEECYTPRENIYNCQVCPGENSGMNIMNDDYDILVKVEGYGTFTCAFLNSWYTSSRISPDACPAVLAGMENAYSATTNSTGLSCCTTICDLCGRDVPTDFFAVADFQGSDYTCYYLEWMLAADPEECAAAKSVLSEACCGDSTAVPPSGTNDTDANPSDASEDDDDPGTDSGASPAFPSRPWRALLLMVSTSLFGAWIAI